MFTHVEHLTTAGSVPAVYESRVPLVRALDGLLSRQFTGHPQRVIALDMVHGPLRVRLAVEPARP